MDKTALKKLVSILEENKIDNKINYKELSSKKSEILNLISKIGFNGEIKDNLVEFHSAITYHKNNSVIENNYEMLFPNYNKMIIPTNYLVCDFNNSNYFQIQFVALVKNELGNKDVFTLDEIKKLYDSNDIILLDSCIQKKYENENLSFRPKVIMADKANRYLKKLFDFFEPFNEFNINVFERYEKENPKLFNDFIRLTILEIKQNLYSQNPKLTKVKEIDKENIRLQSQIEENERQINLLLKQNYDLKAEIEKNNKTILEMDID